MAEYRETARVTPGRHEVRVKSGLSQLGEKTFEYDFRENETYILRIEPKGLYDLSITLINNDQPVLVVE